MAKTVDVYIDSGFTIEVPDHIDINNLSTVDYTLLSSLAREKVVEFLKDRGRYVDFVFENQESSSKENCNGK